MGIGFIVGLIVTGLVAGALGRLLVPGRQAMGIGMTISSGSVERSSADSSGR